MMEVFNPLTSSSSPTRRGSLQLRFALDHELAPFRLQIAATPKFAVLEPCAPLCGSAKISCGRRDADDRLPVAVNRKLCVDVRYVIRLSRACKP